MLPLLKFQLQHLKQKTSWHERLLFSVRLLLEYAEANPDLCSDPEELFLCFATRLRDGSIDQDGSDPAMLYWKPRRNGEVREILSKVTDFSRYLSKYYGTKELNPLREATTSERTFQMAAARYRSDNSFLKHLDTSPRQGDSCGQVSQVYETGDEVTVYSDGHVNFPDEDLPRLLMKGFEVNPYAADPLDRINLKDTMLTLLMWGGGVRTSECFHLWLEDVSEHPEDPTVAWVRIGHPRLQKKLWYEGNILRSGTRAEYLRTLGLQPRDMVLGTRRAGWKNPALDRKYELEIHWSDPEYGRLFFALWKRYLASIEHINPSHPWAFIVERNGETYGQPYAIGDFRSNFIDALQRIGLRQDPSKGHNPHGLRHGYAVRLKKRGLKPMYIQRCLHHASLESQKVYTEQEYIEMNNALTEGYERAQDASRSISASLVSEFEHLLLPV